MYDHRNVSRGGRDPLRSLVLREGFGERGTCSLRAEVDAQGALVVYGEDTAPLCEAMSDEVSAESWLAVPAAWKDELLLRLLAERVATAGELSAYLESHGIEFMLREA
jgi:hypothetical protein